jgi:hypothetical protein
MFATPSKCKSFHCFDEEPKSLASSVDGTKSEANCAVAVIVSVVALPNTVSPVEVRFTAVKFPVVPRVPPIVTLFSVAVPDEKIFLH